MGDEVSKKRELEAAILDKASGVISTIKNAKHVGHVICALNSIATLLFPIDSSHLSGLRSPSSFCRRTGSLVAGILPRDCFSYIRSVLVTWILLVHLFSYRMQLPAGVPPSWLACFTFFAKKHVYDVFFVHGLIAEVVQILALSL